MTAKTSPCQLAQMSRFRISPHGKQADLSRLKQETQRGRYYFLTPTVYQTTPVSNLHKGLMMKKTYAYHKPSSAGIDKIARLRQAFSDLHDLVEELSPKSREQSVALTNLETTAMWAIKAVVCNDPESEVA